MKKNKRGGVYILTIRLRRKRFLQIGKLGEFVFPRGYYTYTGSALSGFAPRIGRHLRRKKRRHWHIDYLLPYAEIVKIARIFSAKKIECEMNNFLLWQHNKTRIVAPKFGSSDCNCPAHLLYWGRKEPELITKNLANTLRT